MATIEYEGFRDFGWESKIVFGIYEPVKTLYYVKVSFDFLAFGAVVGFLVWSLLIRQPMTDSSKPLPLKTLVGSILLLSCTKFFEILIDIFSLAGATVKQSYVVIYMLNNIFYNIARSLSLFVFWYLIYRLLERRSGKGPRKNGVMAIVHWVILGIFSAIEMAQCALYIASVAGQFTENYRVEYWQKDNYILSATLSLFYWVASIEILCWIIFIFVKSGTEMRNVVSAIAGGAFFFFGDNLMGATTHILYNIEKRSHMPDHLNATISVIDFFCIIGTYATLLWGLQKWSRSIFSGLQGTAGDYNHQTVSSESMIISAPSIRSQRATFHSQPNEKRKVRLAVPEGAPPGQQVHMWS